MVSLDIFFDSCQKRGRKIAVFGEIITIFEINDSDMMVDSGGFGFLGELNERVMSFGEVVIN